MPEANTFASRLKQTAIKARAVVLLAAYIPAFISLFFGGQYTSENVALSKHGVATQGQIILIGDKDFSRRSLAKYKITYMFKPIENAKEFELLQNPISMYKHLGEQTVLSRTRRKFQEDQRVSVRYVPLKELATRAEPISRISKGAPTIIYIFLFLMGVLMAVLNTILLAYKIKYS